MSYSRWSHSKWYTYHTCSSPDFDGSLESYRAQRLTVIYSGNDFNRDFEVSDLEDDWHATLRDAKDKTECTDEEIAELSHYCCAFLDDMRAMMLHSSVEVKEPEPPKELKEFPPCPK